MICLGKKMFICGDKMKEITTLKDFQGRIIGYVETDEKGLIIISSECETNCEYAVSKMNIIEIVKIK